MLTSLLPVPESPLTNQVSWIWTSRIGTQAQRNFGPVGVIRGWPPSITVQPAHSQSQCVTPLAKGQRPSTRKPPSLGTAFPVGAAMPAHGDSVSRKTSFAPRSFRYPAERLFAVPIIEHQPVEPSAEATVSIASRIRWGSASSPPTARGIERRKRPVFLSSSTRSRGNLRARSISSRRARIAGRRALSRSRTTSVPIGASMAARACATVLRLLGLAALAGLGLRDHLLLKGV